MRLNIVITSFNRPTYLQACVESIVKYTNCEYAITIVRDKSDKVDLSAPMYEVLAKAYPQVRIVEGTDNYILTSKNIGIKSQEADYYAEMDDDIFVTKGWIENIINVMEEHPEIGLCVPLLTFRGDLFYLRQAAVIPDDLHMGMLDKDNILEHIKALHDWHERTVYLAPSKKPFFSPIEVFEYSLTVKSNRLRPSMLFWDEMFDKGRNACRANEDMMFRLEFSGFKAAVVMNSMAFHAQEGSFQKDPRWMDGYGEAIEYFKIKWADKLEIADARLRKFVNAGKYQKWQAAMANMPRGCPKHSGSA